MPSKHVETQRGCGTRLLKKTKGRGATKGQEKLGPLKVQPGTKTERRRNTVGVETKKETADRRKGKKGVKGG